MDVKKIFIVLITIVACVIIGAFVLNILLPNVTMTLVDATEDMLFNATGMSFDFNSNNNAGNSGTNSYAGETQSDQDSVTAGVEGFN